MSEQVKLPWPWLGKSEGEITDEQIAAFLRSRHKDYPIGANKQELLEALEQAGWEVPSITCWKPENRRWRS